MKKRALISVYYKEGILELASFLNNAGWEIISTGGTSKYLQENGMPVTDVSQVTGFPECLDGRVKTLHPAIHAGILARRNVQSHIETLKEHNLSAIDLVCVNLYPFFEKAQAGLTAEETIEFIDIGGPSMLRSAAKNYRDVIVLTDPADYAEAVNVMSNELGAANNEQIAAFKRRLACKVFNLTAAYDAAVSRYLFDITDNNNQLPEKEYPKYLSISMQIGQGLRYGENAHQSAALYLNTDRGGAISRMEQLHGKELGYNNIRDLDMAWKAVCAFGLDADETPEAEQIVVNQIIQEVNDNQNYVNQIKSEVNILEKMSKFACVAVKHNTPCGIALGNSLFEAFKKVYACDPVSIFGGIIACNTKVDVPTANSLGELFLEVVAAPDFEEEALETLKKKKNLRIIKLKNAPKDKYEYISVDGGMLVQQSDRKLMEKWEAVTKVQPDPSDIADMIFGMKAVTFVKSNAILIVKELAATGIGGGQVNRIWPAAQSLERSAAVMKSAAENSFDYGSSPWKDENPARVLASDAFFPFPDIVEAAAKAGIKAIIQPGGSVNDRLSIEACDKYGIAMVFTGTRHFKH